jgi:xanthine/uracil permease
MISYLLALVIHAAILGGTTSWEHGTALLASYDLLFVICGSLSPFFQIAYQRIMHHSFHNLHMHRTFSMLGLSFAVVHTVLAFKSHTKETWAWNLSSGAFAAGGFFVAGVFGVLLSRHAFLAPSVHRFLSSFHIPFGLIGLVALFGHRFTYFGSAQDFIFLGRCS